MVIISKKVIREYCELNHQHTAPLERWFEITLNADWKNFADMKRDFNTADNLGNSLFAFNIKGNDCRIIARVFFNVRTVFIRFVGNHTDYDKLNLKNL